MPPGGLTGELWIKPEYLKYSTDCRVKETQIGISARPEEIRLAAFGKSDLGGDVAIEIGAKPQGGGKAVDGRLVLPIDLSHSLKDVNGEQGRLRPDEALGQGARAAGAHRARFSPASRAPEAMILSGLALTDVNAERFVELVKTATTGEELKAAFTALNAMAHLPWARRPEFSGSKTVP